MEDVYDRWGFLVSECNELFNLEFFFHVSSRSKVENRPGFGSLEWQFPGFKVQGLI